MPSREPQAPTAALPTWPATTAAHRPWTYWWWMGSAVNALDLTRELEAFHAAGLGGVHVIPIYATTPPAPETRPFLSDGWMQMWTHVMREATRLGLGVDLTLGTGWPYGGAWVSPEHVARRMFVRRFRLCAGDDLMARVSDELTLARGSRLEGVHVADDAVATSQVNERLSRDHLTGWRAPDARTVYALFSVPTGQWVKRAAPGGEGPVLDHFSRPAFTAYADVFARTFARHRAPWPRAIYADSYEVKDANWTPGFAGAYAAQHGRDLIADLPALAGDDPNAAPGVLAAYRQTLAERLASGFAAPLAAFARASGTSLRYQAHGSPAAWPDLYGHADIPEAEGFGPAGADVLVTKMAASAAHLAGRPLVSAETGTWLDEHFHVSLGAVKRTVDQLFLGGVNHVFLHGTAYSPATAPWPGWVFYASTHFGPSNPWFAHLPALTAYITRVQGFLQRGRFDADVWLLLPTTALWRAGTDQTEAGPQPLRSLTVHNADEWFRGDLRDTHAMATALWASGVQFDYVTEAQLQGLADEPSPHPPVVLAGERVGATTETALARLRRHGRVIIDARAGDVAEVLRRGRPEPMAADGLRFVRRTQDGVPFHFVVNTTTQTTGRIRLRAASAAAVFAVLEPDKGAIRHVEAQPRDGALELPVSLAPGASVILVPAPGAVAAPPPTRFCDAISLATWNLQFQTGGPTLPPPRRLEALVSWTQLGFDAANFSGTATYATTFSLTAV